MTAGSSSAADSDLIVSLATTPEQLQQAHAVRMDVFHHEQGFAMESEVDEYDLVSAHFLLTSKSDPSRGLGTIRFSPYPSSGSLNKLEGLPEGAPIGPARSEEEVATLFSQAAPPAHDGEAGRVAGSKLGRLALRSELRGRGAGRLLVEAGERWLVNTLKASSKRAVDPITKCKIVLHSQMHVRAMYEKFGYVAEGEPFEEDGAPHLRFTKTVLL